MKNVVIRTCEVEARWRKSNGVLQRVERSSVLKPDDPDRFRRPVSNALQTQAHVRHYGHVVRFNREMWETYKRNNRARVRESLVIL